MPYRDAIAALEIKLRGLCEARRELDLSIKRTRRELRHHRRPQRRRSWRRVVVVGGMMVLTSAMVVVFLALTLAVTCECCGSPRDSTGPTVQMIKRAAELHVARGGDCPTVDDLIDHGLLDEDQQTTDGWDQPLRIECRGGRVGVASAGPDGVHGTCDDIATWHRPGDLRWEARAPTP